MVDRHSAEGGQIALAVLRVASESRIRSRRRTIQEPRPDDDITGEVLGGQVENPWSGTWVHILHGQDQL